MLKLLIVADDFTGALDTGVKMAEHGMRTKVTTDSAADMTGTDGTEVLVIDAETRHLTAEAAYKIIWEIVRQARRENVPYLYKKTDSALRGNIGAELTALLEASGERQLPFLPALPDLDRTTRDGIHYIGSLPVSESVFGQDPFEPVRFSRVSDLIASQSQAPVWDLKSGTVLPDDRDGIFVMDSRTQEDLRQAGKVLSEQGKLKISAGSAGFGAVLPELLSLKKEKIPLTKPEGNLLVLCGSVNPITREQLSEGERAGFRHHWLTAEQKLDPGYWSSKTGRQILYELKKELNESPWCIIDANDRDGELSIKALAQEKGMTVDDVRERITSALGALFEALFFSSTPGIMLITGGDTLLGCMKRVGVRELEPLCELQPGVVLSRFVCRGAERLIITKSGGFGKKTLLLDLKHLLQKVPETSEA